MMRHVRTVYTTAHGRVCPTCGRPASDCTCSGGSAAREPLPARITVKLRLEKKGRGGKSVTVAYGLPNNDAFLKGLASELKRACGVGGTVIESGVEVQGDLRGRLREVLSKKGWMVKG
jgi:translation initiation factor 1